MNFILQISSKFGQGEGVNISKIFVDIINGSPLPRDDGERPRAQQGPRERASISFLLSTEVPVSRLTESRPVRLHLRTGK